MNPGRVSLDSVEMAGSILNYFKRLRRRTVFVPRGCLWRTPEVRGFVAATAVGAVAVVAGAAVLAAVSDARHPRSRKTAHRPMHLIVEAQ